MPSLQLSPVHDTYISMLKPNNNFGTSSLLFTGVFVQPADVFRSLLKFNLSGVIPDGNTILNASLNLFVYRKDSSDGTLSPQTVSVFTNSNDFLQNTVTWNNAPSIDPTPYSIDITDADVNTFISIDITNIVIDWFENILPNNGITLVGIENIILSTIGYLSSEWSAPIQRPFLNIEYTVIPQPVDANISEYAYIYNTGNQLIPSQEAIKYNSNGWILGHIGHIVGESEIFLEIAGDYEVMFSISGAEPNVFGIFINGVLVTNTIFKSGDTNQQNTGYAIISINSPSIITIVNMLSDTPVTLQTIPDITNESVTAAVYIQKLNLRTSSNVTNTVEFLEALNDSTINTINMSPGLYNISLESPFIRTTAVKLQSTLPGAQITFAISQDITYLSFGDNITLTTNRIYNITQLLFYTDLPTSIAAASPGDTILIFPGNYNLIAQLIINKSLTLKGFSADTTIITFADLGDTSHLSIQSDNVTLEGLHFVAPTPISGNSNSLFNIPFKAFPDDIYRNITISSCIMEGGRRNAFIKADNLSILSTTFIHTGNRNSLHIESVQGRTLIAGNTFNGSTDSLATMTFEGIPLSSGSIIIRNNISNSFTQFTLFNTEFQNASILIDENTITHISKALSGSSIIFLPIDFAQVDFIHIENNKIVNLNANRLAVFLDYRFGGTNIPRDEQIKLFNNIFDVALPWGAVDDTVDTLYPVGFSTGAPPSLTLTVFELVLNTVIY
ncbi:DNRLRE domain-containing protein [Clostridium sp. UBA4395]|uniref:DNRLRE domain-containing protein n=1 Tax=Clostridium sp. UBA4395 TaxID=1946360 RepID=UPI0032161FEA